MLLKERLRCPNRGERSFQWEEALMMFNHSMGCPLFHFYLKLGHKHLLFYPVILLLLEIKNKEARSKDDRQNMNLKIAIFLLLLTISREFTATESIHQNRHEEVILAVWIEGIHISARLSQGGGFHIWAP